MKKILVVLAAVAFAAVAQASELWWTVGTPVEVDGSSATWDVAKIYANSSEYMQNFGGSLLDTWSADDITASGMAMTDVGSATSFYVELYNGSTLVGKSYISKGNADPFKNQGAVTAAQVGNALTSSIMAPPPDSPYTFAGSMFTTSDVIPEPTSGLLVMLGMMMLGLKRKRV